MKKLVLDIGGNGVQYHIYEGSKILVDSEFSTVDKDKNYVLDTIANLINENDVQKVGIASPCAVITKTGMVLGKSAIKDYGDFNLYEELRERLNDKSVFIIAQNDANAALLGALEPGVESAIILTIGSGVGGGIFMDGNIQTGHKGFGGEFGYFPFFRDGKMQTCSETIGSNALVSKFNGKYKNAKEVFANAEAELKTITEWFDDMAAFIVGINYSIDPEVVYLTGGVTKDKLFEMLLSISLKKVLTDREWLNKDPVIKIYNHTNAGIEGMKKLV